MVWYFAFDSLLACCHLVSKCPHHRTAHCQVNAHQLGASLTAAAFPGLALPGIRGKFPLEEGVRQQHTSALREL